MVSIRRILHTWWPLAASWLLMGAELPVLSAVVARLPEPEINLAAYGGVVFPLALIIESPVIMLLAASTALSRDFDSYRKLRRFMMVSGASLTALHILIAFTPLYYVVVEGMIGAPAEIVEPARIGLMIMTPWTWSIGFRRFNQGLLIRFDHSRAVGVGTAIRLIADGLVLLAGYLLGLPGIVVATTAVAAGVLSEAAFAGFVVRPVVRNELVPAPPVAEPITLRSFLDFYIPLAMTSLILLLAQPIGSAALSRMPDPIDSLAVWPVVTGLIFMLRSMGMAYNEVVVALLDEPGSYFNLRRFALYLAGATSLGLALIAATPLSGLWFGDVSALQPRLVDLARTGLWFALALPAFNVAQSWFQGVILHGKKTRAITESVVVYLASTALILVAGVATARLAGLYVGLGAMAASMGLQSAWLWYRSRGTVRRVRERDEHFLDQPLAGETSAAD